MKHVSLNLIGSGGYPDTVDDTPKLSQNGYYSALLGTYKSDSSHNVSESSLEPEKGKEQKAEKEPAAKIRAVRKSESMPALGSMSQCVECKKELSKLILLFNETALQRAKSSENRVHRDMKKQNEFLMKHLLDDKGEYKFHAKCMLKAFRISKGRLQRIRDKKRRVAKGVENTKHGLCGRPSNNRKNPYTLDQFVEFIIINRVRCPNNIAKDGPFQYILNPQFKRVQGDGPDSIRGYFNILQGERENNPYEPSNTRQTISNGTTQAWFNKYFADNTTLSDGGGVIAGFSLTSDLNLALSNVKLDSFVPLNDPVEIAAQKKEVLENPSRVPTKVQKTASKKNSTTSIISEPSLVKQDSLDGDNLLNVQNTFDSRRRRSSLMKIKSM